MQTIDMTPTWEAAARIYIEVLQNPKASREAVEAAKEDILRLARGVDNMIAHRKKTKQQNNEL
jgi:hypothetical protein